MLKEIINIWNKGGLMKQSRQDALQMIDLTKDMHVTSIETLKNGSMKCPAELYKIDKAVNALQMSVRRKILEHLSISPSQDVSAALVLILAVNDFERIGDYCKNVCDLAGMRPCTLKHGRYRDSVDEADALIRKNFELLKDAFGNAEVGKAEKVMENFSRVKNLTEAMIADLMKDDKLKGPNMAMYALLARHLKRIGAHQKNVATAVINPFEKIGYRNGKEPAEA